jgi:hypothetical protein
MGIRRSLLEQVGGFDETLGLSGERLIAGEETALFAQARARGATGVFLPEAWTWHVNEAARLTLGYAWRRSRGQGRTMAIMSRTPWLRSLMPARATWRRFGNNLTGAAKTLLRRPSAQAFGRLWVQAALASGHLAQLRAEREAQPARGHPKRRA